MNCKKTIYGPNKFQTWPCRLKVVPGKDYCKRHSSEGVEKNRKKAEEKFDKREAFYQKEREQYHMGELWKPFIKWLEKEEWVVTPKMLKAKLKEMKLKVL